MLYGATAAREAFRGPADLPGARAVTDLTLNAAIDNVYASLKDNNRDIETHIGALKAVLARDGLKQAVFDPAKLAQNNRQGRKMMQAYFRQRGVTVSFGSDA
jgi:hypothetical protein